MKRERLKRELEVEPDDDNAVDFSNGEKTNEVEIAYFERGLLIDKHKLDEELVQQPKLFESVADRYAIAKSIRDEAETNRTAAKDHLKTVEAQRRVEIRAERDGKGEKVTDKLLEDLVQVDPYRKKAFTLVLNAERNVNKAEADVAKLAGMKDAYFQRANMIKDLCELWRGSYFATTSIKGGATEDVRNNEYERRKTEMAAKRADWRGGK